MSPQPLSFQQEAVHENTPSDHLIELAQVSTELAQLVAKNPSAPSDLLRELSKSSDRIIRKNITANPNTPTEILLNLGSEFPEQLLNNPSFFLLWLEHPNLLDEMPQATLLSLLKQESVPVSWLEQAVSQLDCEAQLLTEDDYFYDMDRRARQQHSKVQLGLAVAMNAQTPKTLLEKLVHSQYVEVQEAAQLHVTQAGEMTSGWDEAAREALRTTNFPHHRSAAHTPYLENLAHRGLIPEFVLEQLARHHDKDVRSLVAYLPNTPARILDQLALDEDCDVRRDVAFKSRTPIETLEQLALDQDSYVRSGVAYNSNTPIETLEQLALDEDSHVRSAVANNPNTPVKILAQLLEQLALDKNDRVLEDVAKNSNTPVTILEQLAQKQYPHTVPMYVGQNPNTPVNTLEQLAQHGTHWILWAVGSNPNISLSLLEQLAQREDYYPREGVAKNPRTPLTLLEQLAQGKICVHESIAKNPNTSINLLEQLAQMPCSNARKGVGSNPNTPFQLLEQLAQDGNNKVRQAIASNPNIPIEFLERLLEQMAQDKNHSLREFLAQHPNTPVSFLLEVTLTFRAQDPTPVLSRFLVLLHPQTPAKALTENSHSLIWLERYAIAQNSNTPTDTLKTLAQDANRIVRTAAKANLQNRYLNPKSKIE